MVGKSSGVSGFFTYTVSSGYCNSFRLSGFICDRAGADYEGRGGDDGQERDGEGGMNTVGSGSGSRSGTFSGNICSTSLDDAGSSVPVGDRPTWGAGGYTAS